MVVLGILFLQIYYRIKIVCFHLKFK